MVSLIRRSKLDLDPVQRHIALSKHLADYLITIYCNINIVAEYLAYSATLTFILTLNINM